jgi:hypothetical protein
LTMIKGNIKYWIAAGCICVILIGLSQIGHAASTKKTYPELLKEDKMYYNEHPSFADEQREHPESAKVQLGSWHRTEARLNKFLPVQDWKLISSGDIDISFTNFLSSKEVATFNTAFYSEERRAALQYGDIFPGALISPNQDQVILFWEKADGRAIYFKIDSRTDSDGGRTWFLNGKANIIDK